LPVVATRRTQSEPPLPAVPEPPGSPGLEPEAPAAEELVPAEIEAPVPPTELPAVPAVLPPVEAAEAPPVFRMVVPPWRLESHPWRIGPRNQMLAGFRPLPQSRHRIRRQAGSCHHRQRRIQLQAPTIPVRKASSPPSPTFGRERTVVALIQARVVECV
jgi:hypothetical protein